MSRFWSPIVHTLTPYVPGEQPKISQLIKLNTNENPYGPSPKAIAAMQAAVGDSLRLYPDPGASELRASIAQHLALQPEQVFVGNGSDEVLAHVFMGLLNHGRPLLFPDISYSFYPVYCGLYRIDFEKVPLTDSFAIDPQSYARAANSIGGIIFPNPNAPTGSALPLNAIAQIARANPGVVVVVDEAYVDFGAESAVGLVDEFPNLLVVQTLSKSRSLAGLRVGFAVGNAQLIEALVRIKDSFNSYPLDRVALAGARAAIEDVEYFNTTCQAVIASRETLTRQLQGLGFEVLPSSANFIFARHPDHAGADLAQHLRARNILVRHFKLPRIDNFLRISIGTDAECAALVAALQTLLQAN